jgi:hypothetical protein
MKNEVTIAVLAGVACETSTGVERGIDVYFTLTLGGEAIKGECTLLPHEDGRPGYGAWGQPDHWIDGRTLARLRALPDATYRDVLTAIEDACAPVAGAL